MIAETVKMVVYYQHIFQFTIFKNIQVLYINSTVHQTTFVSEKTMVYQILVLA